MDVHRVDSSDGAAADLIIVGTSSRPGPGLYWLPAMGVSARHYLPMARALAAMGVTVALHEWRGRGSSNYRPGRRCNWGYRQLLVDDIEWGLRTARQQASRAHWVLGGHSLGGQLAVLRAAWAADAHGIVLVGSGTPHWRGFPRHWKLGLRMAYALSPLLAAMRGHFPGDRLGFAGREARGVIDDWAYSGRCGRYRAAGLDVDLEARLQALQLPLLAICMADDRFGPLDSLQALLAKLPHVRAEVGTLGTQALSTRADHFSWMRQPEVVASVLAEWLHRVFL